MEPTTGLEPVTALSGKKLQRSFLPPADMFEAERRLAALERQTYAAEAAVRVEVTKPSGSSEEEKPGADEEI